MTINKRLDLPKVEELSPPEYLDRVRTDARGHPFLSNAVYERAKQVLGVIPAAMPAPVVKALADGSVMFYWNKTNIAGYDHYDRLELHMEVMPSGRITYSWNALPARGNHRGEFGCGTGNIGPDTHVFKLVTTSVRNAWLAFAPASEIPTHGEEKPQQ